ncbi:MAG: TrmB family transcriptional regulator, partial [Proteobacteria bacterium]|nr:TrmB family transcriptional regulator [Pseudomonadota bacterium]
MAAIEQDVYREVQKMVDNFSMGFPETESGIEIKILKKLFSEDDAKVFLKLSPMLEDVATISGKLGLSEDKAGEKLEDMADRGLAFRFRKGDKTYYAAIPFVHGLFEFQVDRLDRELAELVEQYMIDKFNVNMKENAAGFLRPIPVNQSVDASMNIASYEDVEQILKSKDLIVATDCICRKRAKLVEGGCDKPLEACFMFGSMGQYYLDRDMGRKIDA